MSEESETDTGGVGPEETRQLATDIRVQVWGLRAKAREFKEAIAMAQSPEPRQKSPKDDETR